MLSINLANFVPLILVNSFFNMKTMRLVILLAVFSLFGSALAKPQIYFHYKQFFTPENKAYITTSLQFIGGSFKYKGTDAGDLTANVEITQIFSLNDSIVIADKYNLNSPLMKDSIVDDFYDVQRYALQPGEYSYELIIKDLLSGEVVTGQQNIIVRSNESNKVTMSDIEFVQDVYPSDANNNFTKNGFFLLPYVTNYFPPEFDKIAFYTEFYNTNSVLGENEDFMMVCSVENFETGVPVSSIFKHKRLKSNSVTPVIFFLPIDNLPSGDYNLNIQLLNRSNDTLLSNKVFFQRRNDIASLQAINIDDIDIDLSFQNSVPKDSVHYFLGSILPIAKRYDAESIRTLLKSTDTSYMEKYLYAFWKETSPENPFEAWRKYKAQVYYAERLFGTYLKYGYESDRGRVHLQYGSPNSIVDRPNEPSAYPYQIWHYYRIGQRSNVRFVFYNPDLVSNDYPLLHSDMQGELQNYRWQNDLHKRDSPNTDIDNPGGVSQYGGTSDVLYRGN